MEEKFTSHIFPKPNISLGFFACKKIFFLFFHLFPSSTLHFFLNILLLLSIYNFLKNKKRDPFTHLCEIVSFFYFFYFLPFFSSSLSSK
ncbi:hypothetical protein EGX98_00730 [Fusobacterium necrophorum]|nr:hypothetical protein EGX98_00730 [Fusobacterium necrophorum]